MAKVRLRGNKALISKINRLSDEAKEVVSEEIEVSINDIRNEAVSRVPVDTGLLKNSINVQLDRQAIRGSVEVTAKYAPYVEFGTGARVDVPSGLEDYAMRFKGSNEAKVNLPPQPYLYPAWFRELPEFKKRLRQSLNNIIKK